MLKQPKQTADVLNAVAGQFVMSGFLNFKMAPWKRSCVTRTVAIVPTLVIAVVFQASHKLDQLNQLLNILQSIMLPFAIIPVSMPASLLSVWVKPIVDHSLHCWSCCVQPVAVLTIVGHGRDPKCMHSISALLSIVKDV